MFSDKLRELRTSLHYTRERLANTLGVSTTLIYKWETGQCEPSIDKLKKIADTLGVTLDDLCCNYAPEDEPLQTMTRAFSRMTPDERSELLNLSQRLYVHAFEPPKPVREKKSNA